MQQKSICFIGGGNMAQAIVFGLLKQGYAAKLITVCDHNAEKLAKFQVYGVQVNENNILATQNAEVVLLAVKPQSLATACSPLKAVNFSQKLVISIAAGISSQRLTQLLPTANQIVRVMPNTPALVSSGMAGLYADEQLSTEYKQFAEDLLNAVGKSCWVKEEAEMHWITAASGSSPAYFFRFMEVMQQTLVAQGICTETARLLVQQSALGAAQMVINNPNTEIATLRQNVTSKGGTTAAALMVFEEQQLDTTIAQAMQACAARSQQMEREL